MSEELVFVAQPSLNYSSLNVSSCPVNSKSTSFEMWRIQFKFKLVICKDASSSIVNFAQPKCVQYFPKTM